MSLRFKIIKDGKSAAIYLNILYMIYGSTTKFCTLQADGSGNTEIIFYMSKVNITKEELEDLYIN
jgi:hypothetical protein